LADFDDRTGLSSATPSRTLNEPIPRSTGYTPASRLQKIDRYLDGMGTASLESFPIDLPKYYFKIGIGTYNRISDSDIADVKGNGGVVLPMPATMQDALGVQWKEEEIGWTGAIVSNALSSDGDTNDRGGWQTGTGLTMGAAAAAARGVGSLLSYATGSNLADRAISAGQAMFGMAPNQFLTILFKGPQYKQYTFTWKLAPKNVKESQILLNIIRRLNREASPTADYSALVWRYPSVFQCQFSPNENQMYKFKPAVLRNVVTNYAGSGMPAFYKSGFPESVQLSLTFQEMEFWLKGDFDISGGDTGGGP